MNVYEMPWRLVPNQIRATGGREICRFRGQKDPKDTPNGAEAWVGSMTRANGTNPDNPNLGCAEVLLPDGSRRYLIDVVQDAPESVLGKHHMARYGTELGMLIKLLDAKTPFLLQCHPTRENAMKYWGSQYGKEECWYIIGTRDDSDEAPFIILGFKPGITREKWEKAYREGDASLLESYCHKIPVKPGECYRIPGGVPHALGAGCFVAEIQEPSDLTAVPFRQEYLLDYRRKANPLGTFVPEDNDLYEKRMLNTFGYEGFDYETTLRRLKSPETVIHQAGSSVERELVGRDDTNAFSCTIVFVSGTIPRKDTGDVQIGIVTDGQGVIHGGDFRMDVKKGDEIFFPYQASGLRFEGNFTIVLCNPGETAMYR